MGRSIGQVTINLDAGTAQLVLGLNKGKVAVRDFAAEMGRCSGEALKANAAIRAAEGNFQSNTRAVSLFLRETLHLGPALEAAFSVIAPLLFAKVLFDVGSKIHTFFKEAQEAPARIAQAFREVNLPLQTTNDELRVANARLENSIDKLEGKRENTLALALAEARVAADKLGEALDKDLKVLLELNKKESVGAFMAFIRQIPETSPYVDKLKSFSATLTGIQSSGAADVRAAKSPGEAKAAQIASDARIAEALKLQSDYWDGLLDKAEKLQRIREQQLSHVGDYDEGVQRHGRGRVVFSPDTPQDQSVNIQTLRGYSENTKQLADKYTLSSQNVGLEAGNQALEAGKKKAEEYREAVEKLNKELRDAYEASLSGTQKADAWYRDEIEMLLKKNQLTAETARLAKEVYDTKFMDEYSEEARKDVKSIEEFAKSNQKLAYELREIADKRWSSEIEKGTQELESRAKITHKLSEELNRLNAETAKQRVEHQVRMVSITGNPSDPVGNLQKEQAFEILAIQKDYNDAMKIALSEQERTTIQLKAQGKLQELQLQMEERIAELNPAQKDVRSFFLDMEHDAQTASNILYQAMHSAFDRLTDEFGKLFTGQIKKKDIGKDFGKIFQDLGGQMVSSSVKSIAQRGLGELGQKLGIEGLGPKLDGSSASKALWVKMADGGDGGTAIAGPGGAPGALLKSLGRGTTPPFVGGASGGGFEDLANSIGGFGGFLAGGGDMSAGMAYIAGESGPEIVTSKSGGSVIPMSHLGGATYMIDARGADLGAANRISRAIESSSRMSVEQSAKLQHERARRTPQRTT